MTDGIYTSANDNVFDQMISLLNSIEANTEEVYPICVIAYDNQTEKIRQEIQSRPNVILLDNQELFSFWEDFSFKAWESHPKALKYWKNQGIKERFYRAGANRRYCAFDEEALFDRFLYLDADILVMGPLTPFFDALDKNDFVAYDFQFNCPSHIFNMRSDRLEKVFSKKRIEEEIFCAGCYSSKKNIFSNKSLNWLLSELQSGDSDFLYLGAPNQSLLNYMVLRINCKICNLALSLSPDKVTENWVYCPDFVLRDHVLYDADRQLTYLHYIGIDPRFFADLCNGENVVFPYRELFLYYRYLNEPEAYPEFEGDPIDYKPIPPVLKKRILKRLGL